MKHFVVKVTELDGRKYSIDVLATGAVEACEIVLDNLDRLIKTDAKPGIRKAA